MTSFEDPGCPSCHLVRLRIRCGISCSKFHQISKSKTNYFQRRDMPIFLHCCKALSKIYQICALVKFVTKGLRSTVPQVGALPQKFKTPYLWTGSRYRQAVNGVFNSSSTPVGWRKKFPPGGAASGRNPKSATPPKFSNVI